MKRLFKRQRVQEDNQISMEEVKKLFQDNETESNILIAKIDLIFAVLMFAYLMLLTFGFFGKENFRFSQIPILSFVVLVNLINSIITFRLKGNGEHLKYLNLFSLSLSISLCNLLFSYVVIIIIILPVVLSSRYFLKWFTRIVATVSGLLWIISTYIGEYFNFAWVDLNFYELPVGTIIKVVPPDLYASITANGIDLESRLSNMSNRVIINLSFFVIVSIISVGLAECGRRLIYRMARERIDKMRLSTELNIASKIQLDMLPNSYALKPIKSEFDLSASMSPAKEVGGDFYDFFYVGENHIALVMADVSGKGIPAALFMATAKTVIKSITLNSKSLSTSKILSRANNTLCEGNEESFFVTVWMAIIDVRDGRGVATNAGHENPIIRRSGKEFELVKYKHSMALGVFADVTFEEHEFKLEKGDALIVYTDGVPEAINKKNEQFGEERMIESLNLSASKNNTTQNTIENLKAATVKFADGAEQSDDITILCYEQKA
ncbi:MAG: PP2C family protein-serine/threonine phosphatase [Lachnospiraceae bacterium]|nr:PP2C family protein-serine/threonine phosphatase [Lachnospiraceae bacterium]